MKKGLLMSAVALVCLMLTLGVAIAADYPTRPITMISPMAPGGGHDFVARSFSAVAEKTLGQPLVVINKPGASGMIGGLAAAQATPDGYTLGVTSTTVNASLQKEVASGKKPAFTWSDYTPIAIFTNSPTLIVVNAESPWKTLADLIKDAKAKPGFYAFGSGGIYGMSHLPAEIFARAVGLKFRHVPYAGGGPALAALVGKHLDLGTMYQEVPTLPPHPRYQNTGACRTERSAAEGISGCSHGEGAWIGRPILRLGRVRRPPENPRTDRAAAPGRIEDGGRRQEVHRDDRKLR